MESKPRGKRVLVVQRRLPRYREPFFESLRRQCGSRDIALHLAYGHGTTSEQTKNDAGYLEWATTLATRYLAKDRVCWQPYGHLLREVDLVVVGHENKLVYNLVPQLFRQDLRLALWGHGANLQGAPTSFRESLKRKLAARADWWFAYTDHSIPLIERSGFSVDRITVVNNSIDVSALSRLRESIDCGTRVHWLRTLGFGGENVGISIGSVYAEKRIEFLLNAARRTRSLVPNFELIVVGAGPQSHLLTAFSRAHPWVQYVGAKEGVDKVALASLAKVMLNPGLVGLGILDAFALRLPMVTTDCGLHSPEISYLQNGHNGLMTADSVDDFADRVARLLRDRSALERLRVGCAESARNFGIESMAERFTDGLVQCLERPIIRRSLF